MSTKMTAFQCSSVSNTVMSDCQGSGIYCIGPSAHWPTIVVKTATKHTNILFYIIYLKLGLTAVQLR